MPGIESRAPERTDTSSGFFRSPNFLPVCCSRAATPALHLLAKRRRIRAFVGVVVGADFRGDGESRAAPATRCGTSPPGSRPCRRAAASSTRCRPSCGRRSRRTSRLRCPRSAGAFRSRVRCARLPLRYRLACSCWRGREVFRASFFAIRLLYSVCGMISEMSARCRMRSRRSAMSVSRASLTRTSSAITNTSVKNRSTAARRPAMSMNARTIVAARCRGLDARPADVELLEQGALGGLGRRARRGLRGLPASSLDLSG